MSSQPPTIDYASPGSRPPRRLGRKITWVVLIFLAVMFFLLMRQDGQAVPSVTFGQFRTDLLRGNVQSVAVSQSELEYKLHAGQPTPIVGMNTFRVRLPADMGSNWNFIEWLSTPHSGTLTDVQFTNDQNLVVNLLLPLIPWLLIFGFIWFFVFRQLRQNQKNPRPTPVVVVNPEAVRS